MFTDNQRNYTVLYENIYPLHVVDNLQAVPATLLAKFEKGKQSKIYVDACINTKEKSFVGPIRNDRLVLIIFLE